MGLIGLLKFALICIDFLAWPVIALGYPLFASIRAVETGSKHHLRKLVIYWILFSLISLFEFAFAKIIEWIPFWYSVRLIAIFWLVMPRFNGACYAYQSLVRPVLSNLQEIIDRFYEPKEEKPRKRETFLYVAEKCIKENGSEALEKLFASKHECKECKNSQRDTQVLEPEEKNAAATSKQLKEPDAAQHNNETLEGTEKSASTEAKQHECKNSQRDTQVLKPEEKNAAATSKQLKEPYVAQHNNEMLEAAEKSASTETKQHECKERKDSQRDTQVLKPEEKNAAATSKQLREPDAAQHNNEMLEATEKSASTEAKPAQHAESSTAAWALKGTDAAAKVKEMSPPEASAENTLHPETTPHEWTCDLCKVTTTSEKTLNDHLRGRKHKSKCESLKTRKLHAKDTAPSPSATGKNKIGEGFQQKSAKKPQERVQCQAPMDQKKQAKPKQDGGANQKFELCCPVCNVKLLSDIDVASHLKGKQHLSNIEKMVKLQQGVVS